MPLSRAQLDAAHAAAAQHRKTLPDAVIEDVVAAATRCCEPVDGAACQRLPGHHGDHRPSLKRNPAPAPVAA